MTIQSVFVCHTTCALTHNDEDIQKLSDTFTAFQDGMLEDVKGFCDVADLKENEKQDFILTPGRWVKQQ